MTSSIQAAAAAMLTGGTQTGITFTYNAGTGLMTSTVSGGAGGAGITGVTVQNSGITNGATAAVTTLNFTGSGVTTTVAGSVATIAISGGSGSGGSGATLSDTAPSTPGSGNLWLNTTTGQLFIYTGSQWVQPVDSISISSIDGGAAAG